jgi:hypothetical protein
METLSETSGAVNPKHQKKPHSLARRISTDRGCGRPECDRHLKRLEEIAKKLALEADSLRRQLQREGRAA